MSDDDLLVIGAGHLGARVVVLWRRNYPAARIVAETKSRARHAAIERYCEARLRQQDDDGRFANVLVAVPPSAVEDYTGEMDRAVGLWSREGRLAMVSSTAVYAEQDGGLCIESSPVGEGERARRLLEAEERIIAAGGVVVRMAGLYDSERGPHIVYRKTKTSNRRPDGLVNLIHYDDAAALCLAALSFGVSEAVYMGCDDEPIERQSLVARDKGGCVFTATEGPLGRRCQNRQTRQALSWQPEHESFLGVGAGAM